MSERGGQILALICAGVMLGSCGPKQSDTQSAGYATLECSTCTIALSPIATLGADSDSVGFDAFAMLTSGPGHEFLVAPVGDGSEIGRYARDGHLIGTVGHRGHGPGEFQRIRRITLARADSLLVLDSRLTLLSPTFAYVRSGNLPSGLEPLAEIAVLGDGAVVLSLVQPNAPPFLLFTPQLDSSRALDVPGTVPHQPGADHGFVMTRDGHGGLWVAPHAYRYELLHLDSTGALIDTLAPSPRWYVPWSFDPMQPENPAANPPHTRIGGIWRDAEGRLWVAGASADRNWKPLPRAGHAAEVAVPPLSAWSTMFDSHIDVIDPTSGAVLASRAYDGILEGFTSDGLLWELQQDSSGAITMRVIRAELRHLAR